MKEWGGAVIRAADRTTFAAGMVGESVNVYIAFGNG
jgi:hypothetical protein